MKSNDHIHKGNKSSQSQPPHHAHHNHHGSMKHDAHSGDTSISDLSEFRLAVNATFHCLLGCGIGEVVGLVIAGMLDMEMIPSMVIAVALGFAAGLGLGVLPLRRNGFAFKEALKTVIIAEGLSIVVMETFEVLTQVLVPGVMDAGLDSKIFWLGMLAALAVGFIVALPVNYIMIKKGIRHRH